MSPIIEATARVLACKFGNDDAELSCDLAWQQYVSVAREALIAAREATDDMARAGRAAADDRVVDIGESDAKAIYAAMLDAALWDDA